MSSAALTTVTALRQWLSQNATDDHGGRLADEPLTALIERAGAAIESYCDRLLLAPSAEQTCRFDGDGSRRLILPEWPLVSLSRVTVDGQAIAAREHPLGQGWVARYAEAWIELFGATFTAGRQNVEVDCRLGYDRALAETDRRHSRALGDLEQACLLLCAAWYGQPQAAWADGEPPPDLPAEVRRLLAPYRRLGA